MKESGDRVDRPGFAAERRTPGTPARVLLFLAALFGYALALSVAFPPGAPDRLPVLLLSVLLALAAAQRWGRGARLLALLLPCAGLIARSSGGGDPAGWPTLLFAGFAVGWTFRFIYDFETPPDPAGPGAALKALLVLWALSTLLALVQARTLWSLLHGLSGRTVNGEGLPESTAIRESLLSFGALASGGGFFLLMRRSGDAIRRGAIRWALAGAAVSAAAAILQRLALLPPERHRFWKITGRLSGGAVDPNSLGLLCAMALVLAVACWGRKGPLAAIAGVALFGTGLLLSGSRSGLLVAAGSLLLLPAARRTTPSVRAIGLVAAALAVLLLAGLLLASSPGTLGGRLAATFDPSRSIGSRVSARPVLWSAAWRLFREHPLEGGGMGVFSWELPDLLKAMGVRLPMRDNPGSAYFQALAETGILGLAITLLFAAALARDAVRRLASVAGDALAAAGALASLSFLGALLVGSHWLAPDTGLFFFLMASVAALPAESGRSWPPRPWLRAGVSIYAAAALYAAFSTARPEDAFRYGSRIGLYPPEPGPGGGFQWTRQNFALWLEPAERRRLALAHFSPVGRPVEIQARHRGRLLYRGSLDPGKAVVLDLSGGSQPSALCFHLSRSFVPSRLGIPGSDSRELGLRAIFLER